MDHSSGVGSPDSGIVAISPGISSDMDMEQGHFFRTEATFSSDNTYDKTNKGKRKFSTDFLHESSNEKQHSFSKYDSAESSNKKHRSFSTYDSAESTKNQTKYKLKAIPVNKNSKRKKLVKKGYVDLVENSPVLGIRILPETDLQKKSNQKNIKETPENRNRRTSGADPAKFVCRLCYKAHGDALALAQHRCVRIIHEKYDCLECGKSFACPANLASHRRWHKPTDTAIAPTTFDKEQKLESHRFTKTSLDFTPVQKNGEKKNIIDLTLDVSSGNESEECFIQHNTEEISYPCSLCNRVFRRKLNRRKHLSLKHGIQILPELSDTQKRTSSSRTGIDIATNRKAAQQASNFPPFSSVNQLMLSNSTQLTSHNKNSAEEVALSGGSRTSSFLISRTKINGIAAMQAANNCAAKQVEQEVCQPLDLSLKNHQKQKSFCHSIDEIMKSSAQLEANRTSHNSREPAAQASIPCVSKTLFSPRYQGSYYVRQHSAIRSFPVINQPLLVQSESEEFLRCLSYIHSIRYVAPDTYSL